jgi:hypothetical protein
MSEVRVNKLSPRSGTTVTLGDSGDTITIPSGVTLANSGTFTNFQSTGIDDNATSTAITINSSGNVGIGTSSPSVPLDVNGITRTVNAYSLGYAGVPGSTSAFGAGTISTDGNWGMYFRATTGAAIADFAWVNGAGTERMRIDSSGNLLVGTTTSGYKLNVNGISNFSGYSNWTSGTHLYWNGGDVGITNDGTNLVFKTYDGSSLLERVRITSTGNVGIGTSSPNGILELKSTGNTNFFITAGNTSASQIVLGDTDDIDVGKITYSHNGNSMEFIVNASERMRINSAGQVILGGTSHADDLLYLTRSNDGKLIRFFRGSNEVGDISVNSSSTAYNTSSDYRLKESVTYDFDATTRLKQLKPCRFNFISDETNTLVDGFLAHEAQVVVPECVTGTHNEVDADGNPVYQGIDQSKLVPLLVKTIQELEARITALETQP